MAAFAMPLIGAGISAISNLIGAGSQRKAIANAANVQTQAATNNASLEKNATDTANTYTESNLNQTEQNEAPYQQAGAAALSQLSAGSAPGGEFNSTPTASQVMAQDPGYAFQLQQGQLALERSEAAGGSVGSGGALKAGVQYGQNFAEESYGNALNEFNTNRQLNYSDLSGLANYGQTANQVDANARTSASGTVANTTLAGTGAQTNDLSQAANATAAGIIGQANVTANEFGNLGSLGTQTAAQEAQAAQQSGYGAKRLAAMAPDYVPYGASPSGAY